MAIDGVRALYRMRKSAVFPNSASGDQRGNIVLYDNAFDESKNLSRVLAHEIAHQLYNQLNREVALSYAIAADWTNMNTRLVGEPDYGLARKKLVTPDSANSIDEDFSNNIEYFLFHPSKLKDASPGAYNWIANHFGDKFKLGKGSP